MKTSFKLISLMVLTPTVLAGSLDPPSPPDDASSAMYSIQALCDRLQTGVAGSQNPFTEPTSGPGTTGCTLNDVMSKTPVIDDTNGATPAEVANGKTFWGLRSGNWGLQTGTAAVATVPKTGQTTSYATGDDGTFQKGIAWPSPRFTNNNNGTITDNLTGLIWLQNANCFDSQDWTTALSSVNSLANGTCSLTDGSTAGQWRLPDIEELQSLIDFSNYNPALPTGHPFDIGTDNFYWSASSYVSVTTNAWVLGPDSGGVYAHPKKSSTNNVWPVFGGQ